MFKFTFNRESLKKRRSKFQALETACLYLRLIAELLYWYWYILYIQQECEDC
jgi:hypothetical protein